MNHVALLILCLGLLCTIPAFGSENSNSADANQTADTKQSPDNGITESPDKAKDQANQESKTQINVHTSNRTFEEYIQALNEQQRKEIKEAWSKHPHAKEANGILFLEYESATPKSRGHIFFIPSWNNTASLNKLAQEAANVGYDSFVFLPIPELGGQLPTSEDNQQLEAVKAPFMSYIKAAMDTIGQHDFVNLLLCSGNTISWIIMGIDEGVIPMPDGLIAYNAFYPDRDANAMIATQLSTYKGFFADIATNSNSWLKDAVEQRRFMQKKKRQPRNVKIIEGVDEDQLLLSFAKYLRKTNFAPGKRRRLSTK